MKPERLSVDPNSQDAAKQWKHWARTFENYLESLEQERRDRDPAINKLRILTNSVDYKVFDYIEDSESYDAAIATLKALYVKTPNTVFARHRLATAKQQPGQTLSEFLQKLQSLSKDCEFQAVTAEVHRQEAVRDAFINGLLSSAIRQRLLENRELNLDTAFTQANSLDLAQQHSQAYDTLKGAQVMAVPTHNSDENSSSSDEKDHTASVSKPKKPCYFCGSKLPHLRRNCPARNALCFKCQKRGHFSKCCKSQRSPAAASPSSSQQMRAIKTAPSCLSYSTIKSFVQGHELSTIIDSGSSMSFINDVTAKTINLPIESCRDEISLASSSTRGQIVGHCVVDLTIQGKKYEQIALGVLKDLCADLLLGGDFQKQHKRVVIHYDGSKPDLVVLKNQHLSVVAASDVKPANLFNNLAPECRPIATKSRRFNAEDRNFIVDEIERLQSTGVIRPSNSPWRAQVLVVKNPESGKKRLCVDYSQTINLYTQLDAYPLPRIEDLVNKLSTYQIFSTYDLKSAYHQIPIEECNKAYTAFEACGKLFEFNRIPFGVTNGVPQFQRKMDELVTNSGLKDTFPYLDNVTVAGRNRKEHDTNVKALFDAFRKHGVTLNESKTVESVTEINILGYCVGNGQIKPDPDRLRPLLDLPPPKDAKALKRALGLFSYYAKWVMNFSDKILHLKTAKKFPLHANALKKFNVLKKEIAKASLQAIDENRPFVVECDASEAAISATLNQGGRPVAFMSRTLRGGEKHYPAVEKEATAIIEAIRKWEHLLARQHFTLITDQKSVAFMLDNRKRTKIKNNKIQCWRLELASFSYTIKYRPGVENVAPDALTRVTCAVTNHYDLKELHENMCHSGVRRLSHYVRSKNLPFSVEDVKKVCSSCPTCAELKPQFYNLSQGTLIKATQPFERISIDFKGPLPSTTRNVYLLVIVDEFSRFPFCYPCSNMHAQTVIKCLNDLFTMCGVPSCVHSDNASYFRSYELKQFLTGLGIATSHSSIYHPTGNSQVERYIGVIWRTIRLALKSRGLDIAKWELVLPEVLHSQRSLLCTSTNATPHELFFNFYRKSCCGFTLPSWLAEPGPVLLRNFVRTHKNDDLVRKVELTEANPSFARVRFPDGRESTVSLKDLAPYPALADAHDSDKSIDNSSLEESSSELDKSTVSNADNVIVSDCNVDSRSESPVKDLHKTPSNSPSVRRSTRANKGVPPPRYGDPVSF